MFFKDIIGLLCLYWKKTQKRVTTRLTIEMIDERSSSSILRKTISESQTEIKPTTF